MLKIQKLEDAVDPDKMALHEPSHLDLEYLQTQLFFLYTVEIKLKQIICCVWRFKGKETNGVLNQTKFTLIRS